MRRLGSSYSNIHRRIYAADETKDTRLPDAISVLKDDFDYVLEGFEKLDRLGLTEEALDIIEMLNGAFDAAIQNSAEQIVGR